MHTCREACPGLLLVCAGMEDAASEVCEGAFPFRYSQVTACCARLSLARDKAPVRGHAAGQFRAAEIMMGSGKWGVLLRWGTFFVWRSYCNSTVEQFLLSSEGFEHQ